MPGLQKLTYMRSLWEACLCTSPAEVLGGLLAIAWQYIFGIARCQEHHILGGRKSAIIGVPGSPLGCIGHQLIEAAYPHLQEVHGLLVEGAAVCHLCQQHIGRPVILVPVVEICLHTDTSCRFSSIS